MKYFFDTEFIEDGSTIKPISIGIEREDGLTFYAEWNNIDILSATKFVLDNVLPHLTLWDLKPEGAYLVKGKGQSPKEVLGDSELIKKELLDWIGDDIPNFYAWYASYDWVMMCQIFGTMLDLPKEWPMFVNDVKQTFDELGKTDEWKKNNHPDPHNAHNALADAIWLKDLYNNLN